MARLRSELDPQGYGVLFLICIIRTFNDINTYIQYMIWYLHQRSNRHTLLKRFCLKKNRWKKCFVPMIKSRSFCSCTRLERKNIYERTHWYYPKASNLEFRKLEETNVVWVIWVYQYMERWFKISAEKMQVALVFFKDI